MKKPTPYQVMAILWLILATALGTVFAEQYLEKRARTKKSRDLLSQVEKNPHFFLSNESMRQLEHAVRHIPDNADLAAALSWTLALRTTFLGENADAWQKAHIIATARMKNAPISTTFRIRAASAPLLVRTKTAETRSELLANLQEALQLADQWPHSSIVRQVIATAAMKAGEERMARHFLSPLDPEPFSWLYVETQLADQHYEDVVSWIKNQSVSLSLDQLWLAWIACIQDGFAVLPTTNNHRDISHIAEPFPVVTTWKRLVLACQKRSSTPHAVFEDLQNLPPSTSIYILGSVLQLAIHAGTIEVFDAFKEVFIRRYGEQHPRLHAFAHREWMQKLEPELAWESFQLHHNTSEMDRFAVAAALLSGHAHQLIGLQQHFFGFPSDRWSVFPWTKKELHHLQQVAQNTKDPVLTALWLHATLAGLNTEEWGLLSFDFMIENLKKHLQTLPQNSSWVQKKAAYIGLLSNVHDTVRALSHLCQNGDIHVKQNPHFCTSWIVDPEIRDLYGRYLTAEEMHTVSPLWVWDWMEANIPESPITSTKDAFWQLRRLRYFLRAFPGHGQEVSQKVSNLTYLEKDEHWEIRTEYALLMVALGDLRSAQTLANDARLPPLYARRLAHGLIQNETPTLAFLVIERVLKLQNLTKNARLHFEHLHARARLVAGQDAVVDWENLFAVDPCPENAALLVQAHLARRDKNCRRIREVLDRFPNHPQMVFVAQNATVVCP